jgi:hypothetical protein
MLTLKKNVIFTNVAMKPDGDVWWDGMTEEQPKVVQSWLRTERYADSGYDAAHPNSRFTAPAGTLKIARHVLPLDLAHYGTVERNPGMAFVGPPLVLPHGPVHMHVALMFACVVCCLQRSVR